MNKKEQKFVREVWDYYNREGRRSLPWRNLKKSLSADRQAYHILVSEIMLQQTQVDRVIPKYKSFLKRFPTLKKLSEATLGEVLIEWQGLGYNRRAKMLHECAKEITKKFRGRTPKSLEELMTLPGIGPYTAGAVMAFAYNEPVSIIETNIRTVFIHHFFNDEVDISDAQVLHLNGILLDKKNPREWYYALMDYGTYIKKEFGNPNSRSKHYTKQTTFVGSDRQIRGAILRLLTKGNVTRAMLLKKLSFEDIRIDAQIQNLMGEGMIQKIGTIFTLPT